MKSDLSEVIELENKIINHEAYGNSYVYFVYLKVVWSCLLY